MFLPKFWGVIAPLHALVRQPCMMVETRRYEHVRFTVIHHLIVAFFYNNHRIPSLILYMLCVGFPTRPISNRTGQCNFSGKRDRSSFIVLGQRDNRTTSCQGMGRAGTAYQNPGWDAGRNNHYFSVKIWDGTRDGTITIFFL